MILKESCYGHLELSGRGGEGGAVGFGLLAPSVFLPSVICVLL